MKLVQTYKPDYDYLCPMCGSESEYQEACSPEHRKTLKKIKAIFDKQKKTENAMGKCENWNNITIHSFNKVQSLISDKG